MMFRFFSLVAWLSLSATIFASAIFEPTPGFNPIPLLNGNYPGSVFYAEYKLKRSNFQDLTPLRVSIGENISLGTADDSRASVWMAALVASRFSGKSLAGYDLNLNYYGRLTGPSAGAALCLHFLSSLERQTFPEDLVVTGTVMPDGGIGPVGGVPYKLYAAKKAGFRRALIPRLSPMEEFINPDSGEVKTVDPIKFGEELGIEVHGVETIAEAYKLAVGSPLRKSRIVRNASEPRFSASADKNLRGDRQTLLDLLDKRHKEVSFDLEQLDEDIRTFVRTATEYAETAKVSDLLSNSHYRASISVPFLVALDQSIDESKETFVDGPPKAPEIVAAIKELQKKILKTANDALQSPTCNSWPQLQFAPNLEAFSGMITMLGAIEKTLATSESEEDLLKIWGSALFMQKSFQARESSELAFTQTRQGAANSTMLLGSLDRDQTSVLLKTLITTAQTNVGAAKRVGAQRKLESFGSDGMTEWIRESEAAEWELIQVERVFQLQDVPLAALVTSCFMVAGNLAKTSALYAIFETAAVVEQKSTDASSRPDGEEMQKTFMVRNPTLASRLIAIARGNAESEVNGLLSRYPDAVMPVYWFEVGSGFAGDVGGDYFSSLKALESYYRANLEAMVFNRLLDIQEGTTW